MKGRRQKKNSTLQQRYEWTERVVLNGIYRALTSHSRACRKTKGSSQLTTRVLHMRDSYFVTNYIFQTSLSCQRLRRYGKRLVRFFSFFSQKTYYYWIHLLQKATAIVTWTMDCQSTGRPLTSISISFLSSILLQQCQEDWRRYFVCEKYHDFRKRKDLI